MGYGIGYQGSKSRIIKKLAESFLPKENFYDLFGGGFAVTHYLLEEKKYHYKNYYFNDNRPGLCEFLQDVIRGKYNYDIFKPEWISKERFNKEKENNFYIKNLWSFGNNGKGYLYSKKLEEQKRSAHNAVIFNVFEGFIKDELKLTAWPSDKKTIKEKRLYLDLIYRRKKLRYQLEHLERLERLHKFENLKSINNLIFINLDYREVEIKPNSLIYCDIPYKNTYDKKKGLVCNYDYIKFDYNAFYNWAHDQREPVFISEYEIQDPRFHLVKEINIRTTIYSTKKNIQTTEKLYCNEAAYKIIKYILK